MVRGTDDVDDTGHGVETLTAAIASDSWWILTGDRATWTWSTRLGSVVLGRVLVLLLAMVFLALLVLLLLLLDPCLVWQVLAAMVAPSTT